MANTIKRIIILEIFFSNRITYISQNRSREFISFLVYISVISVIFLSTLIYQGDSGSL